jgi:hypothetical protein
MDNHAVWTPMEARPGKEHDVEEFLKSAQPLAENEQGTTSRYAVKIGPSFNLSLTVTAFLAAVPSRSPAGRSCFRGEGCLYRNAYGAEAAGSHVADHSRPRK